MHVPRKLHARSRKLLLATLDFELDWSFLKKIKGLSSSRLLFFRFIRSFPSSSRPATITLNMVSVKGRHSSKNFSKVYSPKLSKKRKHDDDVEETSDETSDTSDSELDDESSDSSEDSRSRSRMRKRRREGRNRRRRNHVYPMSPRPLIGRNGHLFGSGIHG